ncbi:uncharacterized protein LOC116220255 isoform X3 [Clupea harengus]|uniref:Uncharacterized protein LOC116220255 isoform X3 n=1 Tax=Clupea harengus TaxID=7950 RepID=A0A8M1KHY6_CLUHA|nr:uncharacterized protein LOC116220255 isoform X3 [Clupea harengus]
MPVNFAVAILKGSTSGDYISGRVTAVVSSPTRIQSLTVKAKGKANGLSIMDLEGMCTLSHSSFPTKLKSEMSGVTETSQQLMSVKKEIKEEEFEYLSAIQTVEEKRGLECECKTEMYTPPTMTLKEKTYSPMEIKDEEEFDLSEYGHYVSSPTRDIQRIQSNMKGNTEEKRNKDRCHNQSNQSHLTVQKQLAAVLVLEPQVSIGTVSINQGDNETST